MVYNSSNLFFVAPYNGEFYLDLLHVAYPLFISALVRSSFKFANSLVAFECTILQIPKMHMYVQPVIKLKVENRLAECWFSWGVSMK